MKNLIIATLLLLTGGSLAAFSDEWAGQLIGGLFVSAGLGWIVICARDLVLFNLRRRLELD